MIPKVKYQINKQNNEPLRVSQKGKGWMEMHTKELHSHWFQILLWKATGMEFVFRFLFVFYFLTYNLQELNQYYVSWKSVLILLENLVTVSSRDGALCHTEYLQRPIFGGGSWSQCSVTTDRAAYGIIWQQWLSHYGLALLSSPQWERKHSGWVFPSSVGGGKGLFARVREVLSVSIVK